jgi:hypothetical protein
VDTKEEIVVVHLLDIDDGHDELLVLVLVELGLQLEEGGGEDGLHHGVGEVCQPSPHQPLVRREAVVQLVPGRRHQWSRRGACNTMQTLKTGGFFEFKYQVKITKSVKNLHLSIPLLLDAAPVQGEPNKYNSMSNRIGNNDANSDNMKSNLFE